MAKKKDLIARLMAPGPRCNGDGTYTPGKGPPQPLEAEAAAEIERLRAALAVANDQQMRALDLVSRIRQALGDNGLRMQDELIEHCKALAALTPNFDGEWAP